MEQIEQGKEICFTMDNLIDFDNKFINDKTKLYCEYCLSLNKDYVNSIVETFYERCENYVKKYNISNELEIDKKFITSYLANLAKEGKEICKEVDLVFRDNDELMKDKAHAYCQFISKTGGVDPKLDKRCSNYLEKLFYFSKYESTFREREIDMKNLKINLNN